MPDSCTFPFIHFSNLQFSLALAFTVITSTAGELVIISEGLSQILSLNSIFLFQILIWLWKKGLERGNLGARRRGSYVKREEVWVFGLQYFKINIQAKWTTTNKQDQTNKPGNKQHEFDLLIFSFPAGGSVWCGGLGLRLGLCLRFCFKIVLFVCWPLSCSCIQIVLFVGFVMLVH